MKLTGQEKEQLQQALIDAFTHSSLKQMLIFKLDKDLDSITTANGFSNIVFDLINIADKSGWISQLITSAKEDNPGNQLLANTSAILLAKPQQETTINGKQPMNKIKILFLTANPDNTTKLRLDQEFRDIKERIKASQYRDCFDIVSQPALRINDLQSTLLEHNPHIVHFSGHGNSAGEIILENNQGRSEAVNPTALADLFDILSENIRCVVLNACFSQSQAQAISQHIDSVIGMSTSISDNAAIDFAWAFYQALANGKDINTSFRLGRNQLSFHSIQEKDTPQLLSKPGSDPKSIKLVNP